MGAIIKTPTVLFNQRSEKKGQRRSLLHSLHDVISLLKSVTMVVLLIRFKLGFLQMINVDTRYSDKKKSTFNIEAPLKRLLIDKQTGRQFVRMHLYFAHMHTTQHNTNTTIAVLELG